MSENTINSVCGDFEEPTNPDQGCCAPYRTKKDCERPPLPVIGCDDDEYTVEASDTPGKPFQVVSRLFDENCEPILDENDSPILTVVK
jgi:hypothetical protein